MTQRSMQLEKTLAALRSHGVFLCYAENGVDLWTPNTPVPITLRRAIKRYNQELAGMMKQGRMEVCPSRDLHRQYWRHAGQARYICEVCERIAV